MRAYLDAVHRCLVRRDRREAGRLLAHPCRHALPARLRGSLVDTATGPDRPVPPAILRELDDVQALVFDESEGAPAADALQLELPFHPAPWSRPISLTVARAAHLAVVRGSDDPDPFLAADRASAWQHRMHGGHAHPA